MRRAGGRQGAYPNGLRPMGVSILRRARDTERRGDERRDREIEGGGELTEPRARESRIGAFGRARRARECR